MIITQSDEMYRYPLAVKAIATEKRRVSKTDQYYSIVNIHVRYNWFCIRV